MWNCSEDSSNVTWWRDHSVLCGLWAARNPMSTSGESQDFNYTAGTYEDAGPPPPPMGRLVPEDVGEGPAPWFTMSWFCTTGWSITFGWSGIVPTSFSWIVWCFDQLGKGLMPTKWEYIKAIGFYIGVVFILFVAWVGLAFFTRPFIWFFVKCWRVWTWVRGEVPRVDVDSPRP